MDPTANLEDQLVTLTATLADLGCVMAVAPPEQHDAIARALHPAVCSGEIGSVVLLNASVPRQQQPAYLLAALDDLLGLTPG